MDCCRQDSWIKCELLANKNFRESIFYCGLQVGNELKIEKVAWKFLNKIKKLKIVFIIKC